MTIYPAEFHRRLEQKWATRIDQVLTIAGNATPPRDPWSKNLVIRTPQERHPESAVKISEASVATRTTPKH